MRNACCFLLLAFALRAQTPYDLLLKGGHVIDPKNRIDSVLDVAVARAASSIAPRHEFWPPQSCGGRNGDRA
jgi:hypothetical protein